MSLIYFVLLIMGLFLLIKGADYLINGASSLAKQLSVSEFVIGLTIVAFGTSAPELIVNIFASANGQNDIVFGNIIGSNIFNTLVILGISGLIFPLSVSKSTVWREIAFSFIATILLFICVNDSMMRFSQYNTLNAVDGIIFLSSFIIFFVVIFVLSKTIPVEKIEVKVYSLSRVIIYIIVGLIGLFIGGKLVVDNAVLIARYLSISDKLIALTIVAGGTSLPDLATSAMAAYKKNCEIAVGNIVGSNIFNILFILGISSLIHSPQFNPVLNIDLAVLIGATFFLFLTIFTGRSHKLDRWEAVLFLLGYGGYVIYLIIRN